MINVNKLFRRLSIRTKLVIAFVLLGVVPVAVVGGYGAVFSFSLLNQTVLDGLREGVSLKAGEIQQFLETVRDDVMFLTRLPTLQTMVASGSAPSRAATDAVQQAWESAVAQLGLPVQRLPSGAGHDAMQMHTLMPQAMLFVRGQNVGISHNPLESCTSDDLQLAVEAFAQLLAQAGHSVP